MKFLRSFFLIFIMNYFGIQNVYSETALYELEGEKITYNDNNNLITAEGKAQAKDSLGKIIFADKIIYNKEKSIIQTEKKSIFKDTKGNQLYADNFYYDIELKTIDAKNNVQYLDKAGNIYNFTSLKYFEGIEKGVGQNLKAELIDKSSLESPIAEFDNNKGTLTIEKKESNTNLYTPCENTEKISKSIQERCPDWSVSSTKTVHDKNEKMIYHNNAVIRIKNVPVFYTPYFSHPDPSVKRKSGFLPPSLKNFTDLGQTIKTPYFWAIDESKDLTFSPIYYFEENPIFLTEYRQKNKNNEFYIDASYTEGYKKINKIGDDGTPLNREAGSRDHFFFNFLGNYDDLLLAKNDVEINIQRVSQKNYLRVNQITTENVKQDISELNSNIIINSYEGNKRINIEANIFENLNIDDSNTKYQYTLPSIGFSNFFRAYDQSLNLSNAFSVKNTGGDSTQTYLVNQISSSSDTKIFKALDGVANIFKTSFNNVNAYNQNIVGSKENGNSDIYVTLGVENSFPLIKIDKNKEQTITPKIFTKYTTGTMADARNTNKKLSYDDVYSMNRMNNVLNPETGGSLGYGIEYNNSTKNDLNEVYLKNSFSVGQVLRLENQEEMPSSSSLSKSQSDFVGGATLSYVAEPSNKESPKLNVKYNYTVSNSIDKILQNNLTTSFENSKNIFKADYYEIHDIGNEHYAQLSYTRKFNNDINISFGGRKNIQDNFTENNFIEANYDSECLKLGINLSKTFYKDEDLRPSNNLSLFIVLKPFGTPISPNLSSLLN